MRRSSWFFSSVHALRVKSDDRWPWRRLGASANTGVGFFWEIYEKRNQHGDGCSAVQRNRPQPPRAVRFLALMAVGIAPPSVALADAVAVPLEGVDVPVRRETCGLDDPFQMSRAEREFYGLWG